MRKRDKNKFLELYNKLPISIQDFLASDKMGVIIEDALNLGKVSSEKFSSAIDIVTKVLSFQLSKDQFRNELERRINLSPVAAQIVNKVIETKIFKMFEKELSQYKPQPLKQKILQKTEIKETIKPSVPPKIKPVTKKKAEQTITEQKPSEQIIPEYSFPEPSEVKVEKPVSKIGELKKVVSPKVPSEQQEKIRQKLLDVMQKKDTQPKIVEEMKKVSLKKPTSKDIEKEEKEPQRKKMIEEVIPSEILGGEGKKFQDEETPQKTKKEKPYILDVKLKQEKKRKEKTPTIQEPIRYKKYQKESPFGKA